MVNYIHLDPYSLRTFNIPYAVKVCVLVLHNVSSQLMIGIEIMVHYLIGMNTDVVFFLSFQDCSFNKLQSDTGSHESTGHFLEV